MLEPPINRLYQIRRHRVLKERMCTKKTDA